MTTTARTRLALLMALTLTAILRSPPAALADGEPIDVHAELRAFEDTQRREVDEAIANLQEMIDATTREIAASREKLGAAEAGLRRLRALRDALDQPDPTAPEPAAPAPAVIPGTLDAVVPASALGEPAWHGSIRISAADGGPLDLRHDSGDASGQVQAGALQADRIEIRVASPDDARVVARALRGDGKPVVSWPDLHVGPQTPADPARIEAMQQDLDRLAEAVDRIDRRTSGPTPVPAPSRVPAPEPTPVTVEPPAEIPPAPVIPD
ncbi:hypothetical protein [Tautonia plasticadhaerens]|uniref:Chromosome partition protein Smc n=1 Tax=Tautonia plasticadhaerens TaxID=2527974 RepID=A0A518GZA8_9BACT|nr:hypothetical protein [Tautonia plasticadhaerens]QDV33937.1 hypothetical protein ElP_18180 [Tautonia plasticadhaerens]